MSDAERYARAGFGAGVRRGERPALVVVDLSNGFTDPAQPTGADLSAEVAATAEMLAAARSTACPVVFTTIAFEPNRGDGAAWLEKAPGLASLQRGSPLVEIDARLERRPEDVVVVKQGASAFFGTSLAATLVAASVDTVVLCGATTSGCVRASAVDSVQSGFRTLVCREATGDRAQGPHDANLFDIEAKYADVVPLAEATGYLRSVSTREDRG